MLELDFFQLKMFEMNISRLQYNIIPIFNVLDFVQCYFLNGLNNLLNFDI